jgi:hypothetical protein
MVRVVTILAAAILAGGCAGMNGETEERVALANVPAPVRATLEREAGGAAIGEIERETEGGRTVYEAEVMRDGKKREISVAADGTVVADDEEEAGAKDD